MQSAEKYTSHFHWLTQCVCPLRLACPSIGNKHQSSHLKRLVPVVASRAPERAGLT